MKQELIEKAIKIMEASETVSITSIDEDGYPRTAIISNIKVEGIRTMWFSTGTSSNKVKNFIRNPKSSLCYSDGGNSITLKGDITIVSDMATKESLWLDWFITHFPLGVEDPEYCVFKFDANYLQVWIDNNFEAIQID